MPSRDDKTSKQIESTLGLLEEMVHSNDEFVMTDSEFAFGWHFFCIKRKLEHNSKVS